MGLQFCKNEHWIIENNHITKLASNNLGRDFPIVNKSTRQETRVTHIHFKNTYEYRIPSGCQNHPRVAKFNNQIRVKSVVPNSKIRSRETCHLSS